MAIKQIKNPIAQPEETMCFTVCIKNVLNELAAQYGDNRLRAISLRKINDICGYKPIIATADEIAVPNMRIHLNKFGYDLKEEFGPKVTIQSLKEILVSDKTSLPIVSLSAEYFKEQINGYEVPDGPAIYYHVVIVEKVTDSTVTVFDPFQNFVKKSTHSILKKDISIVSFIRYWERSAPPHQLIYVEKKADAQRVLSLYG